MVNLADINAEVGAALDFADDVLRFGGVGRAALPGAAGAPGVFEDFFVAGGDERVTAAVQGFDSALAFRAGRRSRGCTSAPNRGGTRRGGASGRSGS